MARHYFGYGSLVNAATRHAHEEAQNASLIGWRRTWTHFYTAPWGPGRSLSIEQAADVRIEGALVTLTDGALERLDERERGYDRLELDGSFLDLPSNERVESFYVYRTKSTPPPGGTAENPILRSYMDCVMQGYRHNFGDDGLARLIETTAAWSGAVFDDREAPRYPRAVKLGRDEVDLFDQWLAKARLARSGPDMSTR